jgi:RNA polymerase sigma-70 factor (ECF subfamily)
VTRYQRPLYNAAYRLLGNAEDANDITQIVFVRLLERLDDYDPKYRFFSWIYRIAINESISLLRDRKHEEPIDDDADLPDGGWADPESSLDVRQTAECVQRALMHMKHEDRVMLTLRHFSEFSYREMAEILTLEEKTVKSRLFEARQRLAILLKDEVRT